MTSSSRDISATPVLEEEERKEEIVMSRAKFFLELDVDGPFGTNETPVVWDVPGERRYRRFDRRDCAIPSQEERNVQTNIHNYFSIPELTAEDVFVYFEKIGLGDRISKYYFEGYRACIRPSTLLPLHVRRLILVCMAIYHALRRNKELYRLCKEVFLSMRPPILFLFKVRFYGNHHASDLNILHDLVTHYDINDCRQHISFCHEPIAYEGDVELLEIMLKESITVNDNMVRDAVKGGKIDILHRLVGGSAEATEKVSVNKISVSSYGTPLSYAVYLGNLDIIKFLIAHGADVNLTQNNSCYGRPLECAIYNGRNEITDYLLDCGARVDFEPQYCGNLLAWARRKGMSEEIIKRLLSAGCEEPAPDFELPERIMERNQRRASLPYYYDEYYEDYDCYAGEENYEGMHDAYYGETNPGDCTPEEMRLHLHHEFDLREEFEEFEEWNEHLDFIEALIIGEEDEERED